MISFHHHQHHHQHTASTNKPHNHQHSLAPLSTLYSTLLCSFSLSLQLTPAPPTHLMVIWRADWLSVLPQFPVYICMYVGLFVQCGWVSLYNLLKLQFACKSISSLMFLSLNYKFKLNLFKNIKWTIQLHIFKKSLKYSLTFTHTHILAGRLISKYVCVFAINSSFTCFYIRAFQIC